MRPMGTTRPRAGRPNWMPAATGLLVAGVLTGVLAAASGVLAWYTVPAHTDEAHQLMFWHMGIQAVAVVLFAWPAWKRWRHKDVPPTIRLRLVACLAAILLLVGSGMGGYLVYHGGAGVDPQLLVPEVRHGHAHGGAAEHGKAH